MGKNKDNSSLIHLICFVLFVIWGVGTLANLLLGYAGVTITLVGTVEKILNICAVLVMVYCAYIYYKSNKQSKLVMVLFWIALVVAIAVLVLPFII